MKVGVVGSMQFSEEMLALCGKLRELGHEARTSEFAQAFVGKGDVEKERLKLAQKYGEDAIRTDCKWVANMDALLIANYDKYGIANYIGGNAFIEMAYAYILGQKLFLLHSLPDMPYYGTEIIAMKPEVIAGDLHKVR